MNFGSDLAYQASALCQSLFLSPWEHTEASHQKAQTYKETAERLVRPFQMISKGGSCIRNPTIYPEGTKVPYSWCHVPIDVDHNQQSTSHGSIDIPKENLFCQESKPCSGEV